MGGTRGVGEGKGCTEVVRGKDEGQVMHLIPTTALHAPTVMLLETCIPHFLFVLMESHSDAEFSNLNKGRQLFACLQ